MLGDERKISLEIFHSASMPGRYAPRVGSPAELLQEVVAEDDRLVVVGVARGVREGHGPLPGGLQQWAYGVGVIVEFAAAALGELREALGPVPEPAAQIVRGRDVARPAVELEVALAHPARPEPVHEEDRSLRVLRLVHPANLYRAHTRVLPTGRAPERRHVETA